MEYIGTISIEPRITVHLGEGILVLKHGDRRTGLGSNRALDLIVSLSFLDTSRQQGIRIDGIPIRYDRIKATINILLRGLDKLGVDTTKVKQGLRWKDEEAQERAEGAVPEMCDEVRYNDL